MLFFGSTDNTDLEHLKLSFTGVLLGASIVFGIIGYMQIKKSLRDRHASPSVCPHVQSLQSQHRSESVLQRCFFRIRGFGRFNLILKYLVPDPIQVQCLRIRFLFSPFFLTTILFFFNKLVRENA